MRQARSSKAASREDTHQCRDTSTCFHNQQVHVYLEPLRAPFEALLQATQGVGRGLEGGWEAVKEVIDQAINALRQVCVCVYVCARVTVISPLHICGRDHRHTYICQ